MNNADMCTSSHLLSPRRAGPHLGTAGGKGSRDSKQHPLLALEQLCQVHLVPRLPFKYHHRWDGISHLEGRTQVQGQGAGGKQGGQGRAANPEPGRPRAWKPGLARPGLTHAGCLNLSELPEAPPSLPPSPPTACYPTASRFQVGPIPL